MKNFDIHSADFKLVEKKKIWFTIPAILLAVTIVIGIIYGFVFSEGALNLGMDFTGGYSLTVTLGSDLDDAKFREEKEAAIIDIIENPQAHNVSSDREIEGLKVKSITMQGEGGKQALYVKFTTEGERYDYQVMMGTEDSEGIIELLSNAIINELFADDIYSGNVAAGDSVSATVSSELLISAICGVIVALALMLIYIAVRFELSSGIVALICLLHDIAIMFMFMLVFHIEITSTFVAALITILGYSINNTIIIFDKVRDNLKTMSGESPARIANNAVRDTMVRSINTTGTTFVTVLSVCIVSAIFGVGDLITFCLPLMAGLLAGTFSSILLAPSIWSMWKERALKKAPVIETLPAAEDKDVAAEDFFADVTNDGEAPADISAPAEDADVPPREQAEADTPTEDNSQEDAQVKTDGEGKPSEPDGN